VKRLAFFALGILVSLVLPYVVEYFTPYRPKFADRNNAWTITPGTIDIKSIVRCDGGMKP
jgi:hypothetical protein